MGKISPVSAKYVIQANIEIDGIVERPDVIGAIFGQTEGLLGTELELRELQRSGRIGRIDVRTEIKSGKTSGEIIIPSSLDKAETAIIAAASETIQRIGPCNARVKISIARSRNSSGVDVYPCTRTQHVPLVPENSIACEPGIRPFAKSQFFTSSLSMSSF